MTESEVEKRIRSIALKASKFKIGKTGLEENQRLSGHKGYRRIIRITWAKTSAPIDRIEAKMIGKFIKWKTNDNKNTGSAGAMNPKASRYLLYIPSKGKRLMVSGLTGYTPPRKLITY